jgi:hypothetical protein
MVVSVLDAVTLDLHCWNRGPFLLQRMNYTIDIAEGLSLHDSGNHESLCDGSRPVDASIAEGRC